VEDLLLSLLKFPQRWVGQNAWAGGFPVKTRGQTGQNQHKSFHFTRLQNLPLLFE
jgi:hypothetical protein